MVMRISVGVLPLPLTRKARSRSVRMTGVKRLVTARINPCPDTCLKRRMQHRKQKISQARAPAVHTLVKKTHCITKLVRGGPEKRTFVIDVALLLLGALTHGDVGEPSAKEIRLVKLRIDDKLPSLVYVAPLSLKAVTITGTWADANGSQSVMEK